MLLPRLVHVWQDSRDQTVVRILRVVLRIFEGKIELNSIGDLIVLPFHHEVADLKVAVQEVVHVKVFVVIAKRVDQNLGHVEPTEVEEKLEKGEERDGNVEIVDILNVANMVFSIGCVRRHSDPAVSLSCIVAFFQVIGRLQALKVPIS